MAFFLPLYGLITIEVGDPHNHRLPLSSAPYFTPHASPRQPNQNQNNSASHTYWSSMFVCLVLYGFGPQFPYPCNKGMGLITFKVLSNGDPTTPPLLHESSSSFKGQLKQYNNAQWP